MNKILTLAVAAMLLLVSCKSRKPVATEPVVEADKSFSEFKTALAAHDMEFKWLRMRTKMQFEAPDQKQSAAAVLKMRNDSIIWTSVSFMVEVIRAQITNDSAMMMNRLARQYTTFETQKLKNVIPINGLDLKALQKLLLAYPPFGIKEGAQFRKDSSIYTLAYSAANYEETMNIDAANFRLTRYSYKLNENTRLDVLYGDFKETQGQVFPGKIQFILRTPDKIALTLDVSEYSLAETDETYFSIPDSYERMR